MTHSASVTPSGGASDLRAGDFSEARSEDDAVVGRRIVANEIGYGVEEVRVEMISSASSGPQVPVDIPDSQSYETSHTAITPL